MWGLKSLSESGHVGVKDLDGVSIELAISWANPCYIMHVWSARSMFDQVHLQ